MIRHEAVKDTGSFEVRFPDDRPPRYFYWDDVASRRLRPDMAHTSELALEQAKAFARAERDKSIAKASIALAGPIAGSRSRIGSIRRSAKCGISLAEPQRSEDQPKTSCSKVALEI